MAVHKVRELATRHLVEKQDGQVIGIISLSNILRYDSGVVSHQIARCY
jgi:signal-transduction protein with cAMP-binding, CBS, and nucleotidyltransferase domain